MASKSSAEGGEALSARCLSHSRCRYLRRPRRQGGHPTQQCTGHHRHVLICQLVFGQGSSLDWDEEGVRVCRGDSGPHASEGVSFKRQTGDGRYLDADTGTVMLWPSVRRTLGAVRGSVCSWGTDHPEQLEVCGLCLSCEMT